MEADRENEAKDGEDERNERSGAQQGGAGGEGRRRPAFLHRVGLRGAFL